jgi:type VII secretion protein EccB
MPSRQDQLHSYQFSMQRVVAALVMRETDPAQSPFRRAAGATLASILIAAIIAAGFGVYGVFTGRGSEGWRTPYAVVIEEETGAQFVFQDNKLRPALNFTSAMLAGGGGKPSVHTVKHASLVGVPRGVPFGVAGLPDSLPAGGDLIGFPWSLCGVGGDTDKRPSSVLAVGDRAVASGGRTLTNEQMAAVTAVGRDGSDLETFLLWSDRLFPITRAHLESIYKNNRATQLRVPAAFVNLLPRGERLEPVVVANPGVPSAKLAQYVNGQVIALEDSNTRTPTAWGVVSKDGLVALTSLQADLTRARYDDLNLKDTTVNAQQFAALPVAAGPAQADRSRNPQRKYDLVTDPTMCVVLRADGEPVEVRAGAPVAVTGRDRSATGADGQQVVADYVFIEPGKGALVTTGTTTMLVTDRGIGYALARPDVSAMLGYDVTKALRVPSALAALIPAGPALDPERVRQSAPQS